MNKRGKIKQDFRNLLEIIEKQRPGYIANLGEGLSAEEIQKCITIHPIPEGLIAIYSCISGFCFKRYKDFNYPTDLLPGYVLIEIDKVQKIINLLQEVYHKYPDSWHWQPDMISFYTMVQEIITA
ncbi:hypothetical protein QUB80_18145 [Chlorogloeopsis sp. ULAP01]|uniref:hypothetical protein n=1 Tax=Chlorogloeopsis sp. ULAP01 TaxID=3056483 RepID=UPI0025AB3AA7|nr:hypothetical protein [Chlorogloeopsis sp. ULAP01]MDM9382619.1 hypothetical protein [Chlorogloeopsis sp. ULAP01]